jgi:hypothetical protein
VSGVVKWVVRVKLLPSPEQAAALEATLYACNQAAVHVAAIAFDKGVKDRDGLQKLVYAQVKAGFGLSAQPAVRVIKKVVDAYTTLGAQARAGLLGKTTSRRYRKAMGSPVVFRPQAAQPFDDRCLSWQADARTVSMRWIRPIPRSVVRAAGTPSGPTGPLGMISVVVGVVSLDLLTSSPGSTCATVRARRGHLSPCPSPLPRLEQAVRGREMRPVTVPS